jgi:hypothetical protein
MDDKCVTLKISCIVARIDIKCSSGGSLIGGVIKYIIPRVVFIGRSKSFPIPKVPSRSIKSITACASRI